EGLLIELWGIVEKISELLVEAHITSMHQPQGRLIHKSIFEKQLQAFIATLSASFSQEDMAGKTSNIMALVTSTNGKVEKYSLLSENAKPIYNRVPILIQEVPNLMRPPILDLRYIENEFKACVTELQHSQTQSTHETSSGPVEPK
ncbi:hypothetical protein KI387_043225, partial [Taxus chinensis]